MKAAAVPLQGNPYPGLRPFLEHEEHRFFGREHQVDTMADRLSLTHFLAVVGSSGSGKSSLVNCGLRPALHRGLIPAAGSAWRVAQFRPGHAPIRALAQALAAPGVLSDGTPDGPFSASEMVEATLRMSSLGLIDVFEQARLAAGTNLLVVADQFEELFRYQAVAEAGQRGAQRLAETSTAFVNLLLAVAELRPPGLYVVLTMRSDFLGDCAQFPGLPEAINQGQYLVPRMSRDERRRAIEGPARMQGARIDPVLLTRLVNDVGDLPDQLSLLQHALNRSWARWQDDSGGRGAIGLAHYEAVGSMEKALDQHADEAFGRLGSEALQGVAERVFKALTDRGTDARGVRRPTRLDALCALTEATEDAVRAVIEVFRAPECCFLMPPAGEPLKADTVIDISHESLMRVWQRLRGWADEEARSAGNLRRLAQTATLHDEGGADLLRDPELQMALNWRALQRPNLAWAAQYGVRLEHAMRFLDASAAAREAERVARQRVHARRTALTAAAFVAVAATAAYYIYSERQLQQALATAERERSRAEAERARAEELQQALEQLMARSVSPAAYAAPSPPDPAPVPEPVSASPPPAPPAPSVGAAPSNRPLARPSPAPQPAPALARELTAAELGRIMPALAADRRAMWAEVLNRAMAEFDIGTARRQAAFLAQVAQETAQLRYLQEPWGPNAQQLRYEPPSSLAATLGNVEAGDGERYRGRGLLWITGRANYQRFGAAVGVDLVAQPELAATPEVAARTGAWFWQSRGLNELADDDDLATITRRINGGLHGFEERSKLYQRAKDVLGG